jgi:hypothetical protein
MREVITITHDLYEADYEELLDLLVKHARQFSLAWLKDAEYRESADRIRAALEPYLIMEEERRKTKSTSARESEAVVRYYRVKQEAVDILKNAEHLFSWLSPDYPEELTFYSEGGEDLMWVVVNEDLAYMSKCTFTIEHVSEIVIGASLCEQSIE